MVNKYRTPGRPPFGFVLLDLPSDHEIDGGLVTESQMIHAMLHNRRLGSQTKLFRATSKETFDSLNKGYKNAGFVHLATHGSRKGISMIGETLSWAAVATTITRVAPRLEMGQQRVLCLSCCHSRSGFEAMAKSLQGHFTAAYYFAEDNVSFADAMTTWSMFYRRKTVEKPEQKIVDDINGFFEKDMIEFNRFSVRSLKSR